VDIGQYGSEKIVFRRDTYVEMRCLKRLDTHGIVTNSL